MLAKMHRTSVNFKTIQRILRPYYKISLFGNRLAIVSKVNRRQYVVITPTTSNYYKLEFVFIGFHSMEIYATTSRELLEKVILKYRIV